VRRAAFAGCDASNDIGAVSDHLFGVKGSFFAGNSLHQNASIFINQYAQTNLL